MQIETVKQQGFSLIELVTVLLIITVLSTIAIRSTVDIGYNARYEQTKERLESMKRAIIGNPNRYLNGQPDIHGFVADMGRLPDNIKELLAQGSQPSYTVSSDASGSLGYGWRGPYLTVTENPDESEAYTDGWGRESTDNNYGWNYEVDASGGLTIQSYGKNQSSGGDDYDADYPANQPVIRRNDWQVDLSEGISAGFMTEINLPGCYPPSGDCNTKYLSMELFYRSGNTIGSIRSASEEISEDGFYKIRNFKNFTDASGPVSHVPVGINAICIVDASAATPNCSSASYPSGRTPIPVLFVAKHKILINW